MTEKFNLVPKRRFKEFQDAQNWEKSGFPEIFTTLQNSALSRAELSSEQGIAMNVHYGDVLIKFGELLDISKEKLPFIIDDTFLSKYKASFLKNGDIVIADAAEDKTVGKCCEIVGLTNQTIISGLHTIPCRPTQVFASGYLGYYMNSNAYHDQLLPLIQGTKVSSISKSALKNTVIIYPKSNEEQTSIANYFTSLDNLITLHQRKLEKIKALKTAYLSEMFPTEGKLEPKRRFSGFKGAWEQRKFGELADIVRGASPRPIQNPKWFDDKSEVGWLRIADVTEQDGRIHYLEQRLSKEGQEKTRVLTEPHLLLSIAATVGKPVVNYVKTGVHDGFLIFQNPKFDLEFMFQYLEMFRPKWEKYGQPGSQVNLNSELVKNHEVMLPSVEEQKKIGEFFAKQDSLIALHQRKLEKLQNLKKAYLNEMFM